MRNRIKPKIPVGYVSEVRRLLIAGELVVPTFQTSGHAGLQGSGSSRLLGATGRRGQPNSTVNSLKTARNQNLALFSNFRGMYEPYNYNRKIIGFDTFAGFPSVDAKDGAKVSVGDYAVAKNYYEYLTTFLEQHETDSPIPHKKKFELVAGDATRTIHEYLLRKPETVVALAYFDFDIYQPTKVCLEAILPRLTRGSVIGFDELNCPEFPGETLAVLETIGLGKYGLRRDPQNPLVSWMVID